MNFPFLIHGLKILENHQHIGFFCRNSSSEGFAIRTEEVTLVIEYYDEATLVIRTKSVIMGPNVTTSLEDGVLIHLNPLTDAEVMTAVQHNSFQVLGRRIAKLVVAHPIPYQTSHKQRIDLAENHRSTAPVRLLYHQRSVYISSASYDPP
ncbi:hypothetical protein ACTFIU_002093 [Dictyostelium citrinum]